MRLYRAMKSLTTCVAPIVGLYSLDMIRSNQRDLEWRTWLWIGDIAVVGSTFPITSLAARRLDAIIPHPDPAITLGNCFFLALTTLFFLHRLGLYDLHAFVRFRPLLCRLVSAVLGSGAVSAIVRAMFSSEWNFSFLPLLFLYCAMCIVLLSGSRLLIRFLERHFLNSLYCERVAFIGCSARMERLLHAMKKESGNLCRIVGYLGEDSAEESQPQPDLGYRRLGTVGDLARHLREEKITLLLLDDISLSRKEIDRIILVCSDLMINLRMIPSLHDLWVDLLAIRVCGGVPLLGIRRLPLDLFLNRFFKRLTDVFGAFLGLTLSLPFIAVLSLIIRLESPGPLLFLQTRLGRCNRQFRMIKLRTMHPDAERQTGAVWAVKNDARLLRIGAFMRKYNLDELPQFWNVLRGEMSLVGPRPERPEFGEQFRDHYGYYNLRHSCKPGMTGWAAVNGLRGNTSLRDRLDYDLYYIQKWSLFLDFKIMFMTLAPPKNAY